MEFLKIFKFRDLTRNGILPLDVEFAQVTCCEVVCNKFVIGWN